MKGKIGLFGGTFNPIHNGHIKMAKAFMDEFLPEKLIIIPSGYSYHKSDNNHHIADIHRINMCKLAFQDIKLVEISTIDIERKGNTYTYNTLMEIKLIYPTKEFWWLLGSDSFLSLDTWHHYEKITSLTSFAIALRSQDTCEDIFNKNRHLKKPANIKVLNFPVCPFSSSEIKKGIKNNQINSDWLPAKVKTYIKNYHLYT